MADAVLERVVPAQLREVGALRRDANAFLAASSTDELRQTLVLVVSELSTNAIEALANPAAEFTVRVRDARAAVIVEVEDGGPGFGEAFSRPGASPTSERGRGLAVVRALVDEFSVRTRRGRTVVRCVVRR